MATVRVGTGPQGMAIGAGSLWIANRGADTVSRIDPATNHVVATIAVGHGPLAIAFVGGALWVANDADGTLSRIEPATNAAATADVDPSTMAEVLPAAVSQAGRWLWVLDSHAEAAGNSGVSAPALVRIDVTSRTVDERVSLAGLESTGSFQSIAVVGSDLWVADGTGTLLRIGP